MPVTARWLIRLSLLYFIAGITLGAALLYHKAFPIYPTVWLLLPYHIELLLFGWIIQFTMGTAYWILPRFLEGKARGNFQIAQTMVLLYNSGIIIKLIGINAVSIPWIDALARGLQLIAISLFVYLHWARAVSYRSRG